ncbi:nitrate reductase [Acididesulfobacillus acetoxydans]|uniref:nitrate reductase (quinone) n=1 Tax=Acididesulfobacillus acetoxydans TaxID=1561005 RepID=A0A8S0WF62_9FIRM|nr:nitrate reductase subunit alpha [Acididesulfobacillus acetoxydans]CAA7600702.1 nitrate reductase [Acididesulfobacillus acetoxydans]CEJ09483.1 Nitrate reductase alpha chain [Acididesulfobacillus acetoxydans]
MQKKRSPLLKKLRFFKAGEKLSGSWTEVTPQDRGWEDFYRARWQHDKVVRTTHGVNCTGSCSWRVFVKNGIIAWENQATDYPTTGPDLPEYEPRGCPRGASFSWYSYSPLRVKYPYIRGALLRFWREAIEAAKNPVLAWKSIVEDPEKAKTYKALRGKGGLVRASWEEVKEIISAMLIYTIQTYGPDRLAGFTPIPAMSMVSYAAGSRFLSLLGSPMLSFYDWYADLPPASPQVWGDQTDVPESGDWYNAGYIIMWGSNVPLTRTPDAHFMTEVRYKGTKVISISPDYAESVRFADHWLAVNPGTDGALAQAMTHVILKEFYVEEKTEYFLDYARKYTDMPHLLLLERRGESYTAGRYLRASDLGLPLEKAEWKTVVLDQATGEFRIPNGSIGHRWEGKGTWNLKPEDEEGVPCHPLLTLLGTEDGVVPIELPYFAEGNQAVLSRSVPVKRLERKGKTVYITTVYDLMLANYGIDRGLPGEYPRDYDDPLPYTPAWQERYTGVKGSLALQIAREFARNAADTRGRSMIIMGAGINHWYQADTIYRTILNLVLLTGCEGVNGGGWAHYVGQEKVRPMEGWQTVAFARDWSLPPRLQNATSFYYFATDQWRYEELPMSELSAPTSRGATYLHPADYNALAVRLGWLPSYPQFNRNPLALAQEAQKAGASTNEEVVSYLVKALKTKTLEFAVEDPDNPLNFPKGLFVWRANLISSSGKGHEYFLKHLLGTSHGLLGNDREKLRTEEIKWHDEAPEGKLDLLVNLEFRMSGTALYSDIVLPAATWYEKHDLSSTDMHPFVHPFNPAIAPPWEAKTDWDIFKSLAERFSEMARTYLPGLSKDIVMVPLMHDSPDELAQPFGQVRDWRAGETEAVPGRTMPKFTIVERNYPQIYEKFTALGPLLEKNPLGAHGISFPAQEQYEELKRINGVVKGTGAGSGCPSLADGRQAAKAILALSSATNGRLAVKAWRAEEEKTGVSLQDIAASQAGNRLTFDSITAQPGQAISSPIFSGNTEGNRRYSPFTTNIERLVPFRTLTGRQHFYADHEIMLEFGEGLPVFKPALPNRAFTGGDQFSGEGKKTIELRYLTPHGKWNIHSMYGDSQIMQTLFRGGPNIWLNDRDAAEIEVKDNDWVEVFNRNGVVVARAVVSHRMPQGTTYMYHAQDKTLNTPGSRLTGERAGTHNSPTRIHLKPTHVIGGYAQFSYGFNYYGPTGNQRDLTVLIAKLGEVSWLED